jgi:ferredoxin-thioredoxin reductase catalytic chain
VEQPSEKAIARLENFVAKYCEKSGTTTHPDPDTAQAVILGLARNVDQLGRPLCPCRFYPDRQEEVKHRTWICACDDMQIYKYCHCLLFVNHEGMPITEHLPADHEGRQIYGVVADPAPEKGRPLRHQAAAREQERKDRPS